MDQQDKIILQKVRSYRGILSAGMRLYISAFRSFFKASWLTALIYALVNAALGTLTAIYSATTASSQRVCNHIW